MINKFLHLTDRIEFCCLFVSIIGNYDKKPKSEASAEPKLLTTAN